MSDDLTRRIIGAAIEVHRHLGPGLLESIYEEALCHELDLRRISYQRQCSMTVRYKGKAIKGQRIDLVVAGEVVVEVKARQPHADYFTAQLLSYLTATSLKRGLLLNFSMPRMVDGVTRISN